MASTEGAAVSEWQRRVEDTWYGQPTVFDAAGNRLGSITVRRTVRQRPGGDPEIAVTNDFDFEGPLAQRLGERELVLWIKDEGSRRLYDGRDFQGGGTPYGRLLLGQDFIIPWGLETVVVVQVMPDGSSQLYSNLAFQGPTLVAVLGGLYATGVDDVEAFEREQRDWGTGTFAWGERSWHGEVEVHDGHAARTEAMTVTAGDGRLTVSGGGLDRQVTTTVTIDGSRQQYTGPDVIGNAIAYGPMLFGTRHMTGRGIRLTTRDVLIDDGARLVIAHQHHVGDARTLVVNGVLDQQGG